MTEQFSPDSPQHSDATPVVTVIQHQDNVPLDRLEPWLADVAVRIVRPDRGEDLPPADELDGLIVLGGSSNAYDAESAPWLAQEGDLMLAAIEREVPVLGICLGAQVLAVAGGGQVSVNAPSGPERGIIEVRMRPDAAADPVLGGVVTALGRTVPAPSMHDDAITSLPDGAVWLASSATYPFQAFRLGSALGVQFHPEAGPDLMHEWASRHPDTDLEALAAGLAASADDLPTLAQEIAEGFVAQVLGARDRVA
ncbi:type 1 glutamine amidotransferase [Occultella glacieicola]|uniref:Type 1 glutamine amidotransferase n=1 Tax=Occultella glacieicola TaxID=2518684 RepID=A0ABY2E3G3_9MICO|nr:type 1 glutamine amidotransferase [Occultella glacieicola]TDE94166.1 type 1 glutamine amidotransferase [Occultella glacieicola]